MAFSLIWLSRVLQEAGLKVSESAGWQERGRTEMGEVLGVLCHHTATPGKTGNMPTLSLLIKGRPDLAGPLSQLGLGRDGTYYIIGAGKCNHAGAGEWPGNTAKKGNPGPDKWPDNIKTHGNSHLIGIEAENTGGTDDYPWPAMQLDAYHRGVAAILKHIGKGPENCIGHKEWAPGRKTDPDLDMTIFRAAVNTILNDSPEPVPVPPINRPVLRSGVDNDPVWVKILQVKMGIKADGIFGPNTAAAVRAFQAGNGIPADGVVGQKTWALIA